MRPGWGSSSGWRSSPPTARSAKGCRWRGWHPPVTGTPCAPTAVTSKPVAVDGEQATFNDSAKANVAAGDAFAARMRAMVDQTIRRRGVDAPPAEPDDHDAPIDLDPPSSLDLRAQEVGSVVWCTGFTGDFSWLDPA